MSKTPRRLKRDAIAEAICEVRFDSEESASFPEIVVSKLAEFDHWQDFQKKRLPISDIPAQIRSMDPNLKKQPMLELRRREGSQLVKIGANVMSVHLLAPYPGWEHFKPEINLSIDYLFGKFKNFKNTRIGFRYINNFTSQDHGVDNVHQLHYSLEVAGQELDEPQNVNYRVTPSDKHSVVVRISSPEFVTMPAGVNIQVLVDIDVFTPDNWEVTDADIAMDWIEDAHTFEKEEFFRLFTKDMRDRLVEIG